MFICWNANHFGGRRQYESYRVYMKNREGCVERCALNEPEDCAVVLESLMGRRGARGCARNNLRKLSKAPLTKKRTRSKAPTLTRVLRFRHLQRGCDLCPQQARPGKMRKRSFALRAAAWPCKKNVVRGVRRPARTNGPSDPASRRDSEYYDPCAGRKCVDRKRRSIPRFQAPRFSADYWS